MNTNKVRIVDWAGNVKYHGKTFDSLDAAHNFLTTDQHRRHPDASEKEFEDILGEFYLDNVGG